MAKSAFLALAILCSRTISKKTLRESIFYCINYSMEEALRWAELSITPKTGRTRPFSWNKSQISLLREYNVGSDENGSHLRCAREHSRTFFIYFFSFSDYSFYLHFRLNYFTGTDGSWNRPGKDKRFNQPNV